MPVYKLEIVKQFGAGSDSLTWRNVYHLNEADIASANAIADDIVSAEAALHATTVHFVSKTVSIFPATEPRISTPFVDVSGDRSVAGDPLPLFNVLDVRFRDASGGREERKYYRVVLGTGDVDGSTIKPSVLTPMQAVIDALVASVFSMCSPGGDSIVEGTCVGVIGMRQEHWHRRSRPGFHRGYVANA